MLVAAAMPLLISCGYITRLVAIVVDGQTKKPIAGVSVSNKEEEFHGTTNKYGSFRYHRYGSPAPLTLYFEKEGYKSDSLRFKRTKIRVIKLDSLHAKPTAEIILSKKETCTWVVFGDPVFNVNAVNLISKNDFDALLDSCIHTLQTTPFLKITDSGHISIIKCLNTGYFKNIRSERMKLLIKTAAETGYEDRLTRYYNGDIDTFTSGTYYPGLKIQLYGKKRPYAYFKIIKKR